MLDNKNQKNIAIEGNNNKVVNGNDNSVNNITISSNGKLSSLFDKLKEKFENGDEISKTSEDLKRYTNKRDTIGLEQKLKDGNKEDWYDDFSWCKQEFHKKLVLYQNYAPAQEIFAFILAIVLEKYRQIIKPMIRDGQSETIIFEAISNQVTNPILNLIQEEGCNDIMGLSSTEIEGMFHYLTGNCHIKWTK